MRCPSRTLLRAFKPRDGGAKYLRHKSIAELGLDSPTNFEARIRLRDRGADDLVTIDVASNDPVVMQVLKLHLYGHVEELQSSGAPPPTAAYRRVAMHLGAMPAGIANKPVFLDDSIDFFRRANAKRHGESVATTMSSIRGASERSGMEGRRVHVQREHWTYATLTDGCIALKTTDHPDLEKMESMQSEITGAKLLRMKLDPLETTPYIARSDDAKLWACFGGPKVPNTDDIEGSMFDLIHWAYCSAMMRELRGVWVRGAGICDAVSGDATLITGTRSSGKVSLALHCLAAHEHVQFLGSESCFVFAHPVSRELMVASLPISPPLRLGTLMGTLHPNPALSPPDPSMAVAAAQNSLSTIWHRMSKAYRCPIAESFGLSKTCVHACRLKAVVDLRWSTSTIDDTHSSGACYTKHHSAAHDLISSLEEDAAFMNHPLLEFGNDAEAAPDAFSALLAECGTPTVHTIAGDVAFAKAVRFVVENIFRKDRAHIDANYQRQLQ